MSTSNKLINLKSLIGLSAELNRAEKEDDILSLVLLSLMGKLRFIRGTAFFYSSDTGTFKNIVNKSSFLETEIETLNIFEVRNLRPNISTEKPFTEAGFSFIVPVIGEEEIQAFFLLGGRFGAKDIHLEELNYAELIASICKSALNNVESKKTLIESKKNTESKNLLLGTLFEISQHFSKLFDYDEILQSVQRYLMGQLRVTRYAILLYDNDKYKIALNRFECDNLDDEDFTDDYYKLNAITEVDNIDEDSKFITMLKKAKVKIINPIIISGKRQGVLLIGKQISSNGFSSLELNFINALGHSAGAALENEKYINEVTHRQSLEREMQTANEIQKGLLPKDNVLHLGDYEISGLSVPARYAAGDYYDFITITETKAMFIIADVSGKGIPASLIMANLQAALRVLAPLDLPLKELITQLNEIVFQNTSSDKFVTAFLGEIDIENNTLEYINAGHDAPILIDAKGEIRELDEGGLILGFSKEYMMYGEGKCDFRKGSTLILYTDGVTEALNEKKQEYGKSKFSEFIKTNTEESAISLCNRIIEDVEEFSDNNNQYDDITLLVVKRDNWRIFEY